MRAFDVLGYYQVRFSQGQEAAFHPWWHSYKERTPQLMAAPVMYTEHWREGDCSLSGAQGSLPLHVLLNRYWLPAAGELISRENGILFLFIVMTAEQ